MTASRAASPYAVIVCGDFNDGPMTYTYNRIRGDLQDTFVESGRVGKVVFACRDSSQQAAIESAVEKYFPGCGVETIFCRGGAERGDSVFNGLTALGGGDDRFQTE